MTIREFAEKSGKALPTIYKNLTKVKKDSILANSQIINNGVLTKSGIKMLCEHMNIDIKDLEFNKNDDAMEQLKKQHEHDLQLKEKDHQIEMLNTKVSSLESNITDLKGQIEYLKSTYDGLLKANMLLSAPKVKFTDKIKSLFNKQ